MIESRRLIIRPFKLKDVNEAFIMYHDPVVMKFIPFGPDKTVKQTEERVKKYIQHYVSYGYSKYVLKEKVTGKLIGDCGVLQLENTGLKEIGFRINRKNWGKGLATESALAVLNHCFNNLQFVIIHAIVEKENSKSIYILKNKLFFDYSDQIESYGKEMLLYYLTKEKFMEWNIAEIE